MAQTAQELFDAEPNAQDLFDSAPDAPQAPTLVPPAPSVAAPPVEAGAADYDEGTVKKIIDSAASVGTTVSREEAIRRARNTQALMKAGPDQQVLRQGEAPSRTKTFIEGTLQGMVPFGIGPLVLPPIEGGFSYFPGLEDLSMEAQAQRREENPGTFLAGEVAGSLVNAGSSILAKGASKAAEKTAGFLGDKLGYLGSPIGRFGEGAVGGSFRLLGAPSVGERLGQRAAARAFDKILPSGEKVSLTIADQVNKATVLADELLLMEGRGEALSKAEKILLDTWKRRATPTFVEKGLEKIPRFAKGRNAAEISRDAADRVLAERMMSQQVSVGLENLGSTPGFQKVIDYGKLTLPRLIAPAVDSAIYAGSSTIRDLKTMTPEEVASTGETYTSKLLKDTLTAGGAGAGLGLVVPFIPASLRRLSQGVNYGMEKITENLLPFLGSKGTRATSGEIRAAVDAVTGINKINVRKAEKQLITGLQAQYDNAERYAAHLQGVVDDAMRTMTPEERDLLTFASAPQILDPLGGLRKALDDVRDAHMTKIGGKPVFKSQSVLDEIYKGEVVDSPVYGGPTGETTPRLVFPAAIQNLQNEINKLERSLVWVMENINDIGSAPTGTGMLNLFNARKAGSTMMQAGLLPDQLGFSDRLLNVTTTGIYPAEFTQFRTGFPTDVAVAESRAAEVKSGTRGPVELAGLTALARFLFTKSNLAAGGGGLAAKTAIDMIWFPGNVIDNYRKIGGALNRTSEKMDSLSKYLTATKPSYTAARPIVSGATKKETNLGISAEEAATYYAQDKDFLDKLEGPDGLVSITDQFAGQVDDVEANAPNLASSINATLPRQALYMKKKMDQLIGTTPNPTRSQLYQYGIASRYVRDPETIIDDIMYKKYVPTVAMEVLNEVYPSFLYQLRNNLFDNLSEIKDNKLKLDPTQTLIIDTLLGKQTKGFSTSQIRQMQADMNAAAPKPGEGKGGSPSKRRLEVEQSGTTATLR